VALQRPSGQWGVIVIVVERCLAVCFAWLQGELDELEREEFFRLKKVQSNKKKHAEAAEALEATRGGAAAAAAAASAATAAANQNKSANVLTEMTADPDIIF
jgi:V-type H+-transporting ATPase subunit D